MPQIVHSIADGVAHVEIDRADKLNSLTRDVFEELVEVGLHLSTLPEVRAIVLSGRGRAFSAGLDLAEMARIAEEGPSGIGADGDLLGSARALAQKAVHVWSLVEVPVIAAVTGPALGGGMQIALGADIRVASPDSQFSLMEIKWGIIPDMCGTQLLPRLVGPGMAKKLIVTGEAIGGVEAQRIGLVEELAEDPIARALELAADIAAKSRQALVWSKRLVDLSYSVPFAEGLAAEQQALSELLGSDEQRRVVEERLTSMRASRR
ncbi:MULTISPECIES: enoyl-CoA hydratase-related protein [Brevibacterium]|mgnify:CR=1 FL=1|uniref:Enoyl-CoA hydratase/isomerase family protein n=1 Tax=Brevibacterium casei TaxID=33889 RepID=A0A7T4A060_9MICO|nr:MULTISPECIES: enoyl-CoA hydratase-related protein [Brevibacterium]QQB14833.1 enoyl-CoA hydratase/isomerase family protein [Brevibacterium casei]